MPLFQISNGKISLVKTREFDLEKTLQTLIENNLEPVFNCRFIASEFSTGLQHAGRIDTLALSEENNPVILEYKKVESSELINQSLYYLNWINDHRGDFQVAVNKKLGNAQEVDWDNIRVICIAPGYKKFDLHAVQVMGANIELWQYKLYENGALHIEDIFRKTTNAVKNLPEESTKNPVMVAAGKKAALTRTTGTYTFEEHTVGLEDNIRRLVDMLREYLTDLDDAVEEVPKKLYVAYKLSKNFCCLQTSKNKVTLYLKLDPKEIKPLPDNLRDVSNTGHYGTGDLEVIVKNENDIEVAKAYIKKSFENIGG